MKIVTFENYYGLPWSDMAADHTDRIASEMATFIAEKDATTPATRLSVEARSGVVDGITYDIEGEGPVVLLFPAAIAPSQWAPVAHQLADRHTVITLSGAHLGIVAVLEARGRDPFYRRVLRSLLDEAAVGSRDRLLEVGCGSGVIMRWLADEGRCAQPVVGVDLNPFFLKEARALAERERLAQSTEFHQGNAEALPFDDNSFDIVLSSTVIEECDADKAIAEMVRVLKPGGRLAVKVRAIDMPIFWNLPIDPELKAKANTSWRAVGPAGCADASLLGRFLQAGLEKVSAYPHFHGTSDAKGAMWQFYETRVLDTFNDRELRDWNAALDEAVKAGTAFMVHPVHCAVGTKPH